MSVMSRLRFSLKLGLIGLLFLAPMAALVLYLYKTLDAEIDITKAERLGVPVISESFTAARTLGSHRNASVRALREIKLQKLNCLTSRAEETAHCYHCESSLRQALPGST
jgi:hypothetical protein